MSDPYQGIGRSRLRLHGGNVFAEFERRFGSGAKVLAGEVVTSSGAVVSADMSMPPGSYVFLYRELPDEVPVPFDIPVLYRDDDIVVVDKPHFLATMPRGSHVVETALVRLRRSLALPELSPAHRLDRLTAGVLLFTARREVRGRYQTMFAAGVVSKTYLAVSQGVPTVTLPAVVRNRIVKQRGVLQAAVEEGEVNAVTLVESLGPGSYRLTPTTGRTHQLRLHMASLGMPIDGDPLYPDIIEVAPDDFSTPLRLVAARLEFDDPVTGERRRFDSPRLP